MKKSLTILPRTRNQNLYFATFDLGLFIEVDSLRLRIVAKSRCHSISAELTPIVVVMQTAQQYQIAGVARSTRTYEIPDDVPRQHAYVLLPTRCSCRPVPVVEATVRIDKSDNGLRSARASKSRFVPSRVEVFA